jgi:rhodanese-related sulfurtransferase
MAHSPRFLALVDAARARIAETTPEAVRERRASGEPFALVDVREQSEWQAGRIPGAVHAGKGVIERDAERLFPDLDGPLVLYCGGGYRSALAADALRAMGYTAVESMDGGIRRWRARGYDEDTAPPEA